MRKEIEWIEREGPNFGPEGRRRNFNFNDEKPNTNKASLGVMIDDTDDGVVITDMIDGSAAGAAGLRRGDVLLKINDKYIFTC
jgi:S1-C subfamily serine protease